MTIKFAAALLGAALTAILSAGTGPATAMFVREPCVPRGAVVTARAGNTYVYAFAGGRQTACGSFGDPYVFSNPVELEPWGSVGGGGIPHPTVNDDCVVYTDTSGSSKYATADARIAIFNLRDRTRTYWSVHAYQPDDLLWGRLLLGPGCTVAAELGDRYFRADAGCSGTVPADGSLDSLAAGLKAPLADARPIAPPYPPYSTLLRPIRISKQRNRRATLTMAFSRMPWGVTLFVGGRPVVIPDLPWRMNTDHRPYTLSLQLPALISALMKPGDTVSVDSITCRGGCTTASQPVRVSRTG